MLAPRQDDGVAGADGRYVRTDLRDPARGAVTRRTGKSRLFEFGVDADVRVTRKVGAFGAVADRGIERLHDDFVLFRRFVRAV